MDNDPEYRRAIEHWAERSYKAAHSSDQATPFTAMYPRSADAEVLFDLPRLRARSRELERDDPIASGLFRTFVTGIVGTGIDDRANSNTDADKAIDEVWREIRDTIAPAERADWYATQRLLAARLVEDGEVFIKRSAEGSDPMFVEVVEAERVQTPLDARTALIDQEGQIRDGIERDRHGRIVAYWISKIHPGDTGLPGPVVGKYPLIPPISRVGFDQVLEDQVFHLRLVNRPGQSRGVPLLHAVVQDLRDLDFMIVASLKRIQVAACFAAFIESPENMSSIVDVTKRTYGYQLDQNLVPGMLFQLFPGETVKSISPNFNLSDLDVFVKLLARRIGTALGVSWQVVLHDYSDANYSSARMDGIEAEQSYSLPRQQLIKCIEWIRFHALEDAVLRGDLSAPEETLEQVQILPPAKRWVDPEKAAKGVQIQLDLGLTCLRDEAAKLGRDWEDLAEQKVLEEKKMQELREEAGIVDPEMAKIDAKADAAVKVTEAKGASGVAEESNADRPREWREVA